MHGKTHADITKSLFPHINSDVIERVNREIDDPSARMIAFNRAQKAMFGKNAFVIPGLDRTGHRTNNHDLLSAMVAGFMTGGPQGVQAAMAHMMEDQMSDAMRRSFGVEGRDMLEAFYMFGRAAGRRR